VLESRWIIENDARYYTLGRIENGGIGAQRPAFAFQEPLEEDLFAASLVVNEVVLERLYEKWFEQRLERKSGRYTESR
jgi:hypothetical protein